MEQNKLAFPRVLRIEPSSLCNLRCRHCPTGTMKNMDRGVMSKETFSMIIDNIRENIDNIKVIVLYHGGEPFINKNFVDMLRRVKLINKSLFVKINSNGMLLNNDIMEGIIKYELDNLYIAIDGISPEENNFIRINSDYKMIIENIKKLIEMKKKYKSDLPKIKVTNVQFVESINRDIHNVEDIFVQTPEFLLDEFKNEYEREELEFQSLYPLIWPDIELDNKLFHIQKFNNNPSNYCDHVINTITVRWNGDVVVCCYDLTSKYVVGNINDNSLSDIWNNKKYLEIRESIKNKKYLDLCENCLVVSPVKQLLVKEASCWLKNNA